MGNEAEQWYEQAYRSRGPGAQRRYPNEELVRFASGLKRGKALEMGCGSGGNLWYLAREGFDTYGCDISNADIEACRGVLQEWGVSAALAVADMRDTPFADGQFDLVADVFSSYCLDEVEFGEYLAEVRRVLSPSGVFFLFAPSTMSDVFKAGLPRLDATTQRWHTSALGLCRQQLPFPLHRS